MGSESLKPEIVSPISIPEATTTIWDGLMLEFERDFRRFITLSGRLRVGIRTE